MNSILYTVLALIAVVLAQAPETPQIQRGQEAEQQRPLDGGRFDRGFRVESPTFLQCTCSDPVGLNRCRTWRCLDLDVDRRR